MIIDLHTHRYPGEVTADPLAWARARGENIWGNLMAPDERGRRLQTFPAGEVMLRDMDQAGVDHAVMLGWYWERQESCDWHNAWMARWVGEHPDRFSAFASVQPAAGPAALEGLRRSLETGCFRGIGEMQPSAQGFARDHPTWLEILELAVRFGLPVNQHVTEPVGHRYPGKIPTPLEDIQWTVEQYPQMRYILAHWGGGLPFYELNRTAARALRNSFYDTAASPLLYGDRVWNTGTALAGAERVCFGSDYGLRVYPKLSAGAGWKRMIQRCRDNLPAEMAARVLGGNTRRLLGL